MHTAVRTPFQTVSKRSTLSIECAKGVGYAPYPSAQREALSEGAYTPCTYLRRSHKPSETGYPDTSSPISWPETLLWHCPLLLSCAGGGGTPRMKGRLFAGCPRTPTRKK